MAGKQELLIQTLLEQNNCLNASQLANQLGVSVRTVHNYINAINQQYPGAITNTSLGYEISQELARTALKKSPDDIPQNATDRCTYLLNRLVQSGGALDLYDLCDEIYISTTTFQGLLGRMRKITRDFDLSLTLSSNTVTLTGTERNKRRLLSSLLYQESSTAFTSIEALQEAFPSIDIELIRDNVVNTLHENHFFINDYSLLNLLLHITIAIDRIQNGCITPPQEESDYMDTAEYHMASLIIQRLETHFQLTFSQSEVFELAFLLSSRASSLDYQSITVENISHYIGKECLSLVQYLIKAAKEDYGIYLDEPEFFIRFALHIHNLLIRATNQSFCKNPLVSEIRKTCPLIYDVSVQLSGLILEHTDIFITEDEIAYIALHLGGALEAQKETLNCIPAVLYCPGYYNMDSSLGDRLSKRLFGKILLANVYTQEEQLANVNASTLVISTVKIHNILNWPLVMVSPFLTNTDFASINRKIDEINTASRKKRFRQYLNQLIHPDLFECSNAYQNKEELLHHICKNLYEMGYTNEAFEQEVLERENMSSTAFNQFAIPHTLKMHAWKTAMYIYSSHIPVKWDDNMVNLVIVLCFNPNERKIFYDIFEPLTILLLDANHFKNLLSCRNYIDFIDYLAENLE